MSINNKRKRRKAYANEKNQQIELRIESGLLNAFSSVSVVDDN